MSTNRGKITWELNGSDFTPVRIMIWNYPIDSFDSRVELIYELVTRYFGQFLVAAPLHRLRRNIMEPMLYVISGLGVAGIYCVYSHYYRDRVNKIRALRRRVTYMLWKAARKAG